MRARLAIISTHPIQYYAPVFRRLAEGGVLDVHVFYGWEGLARSDALDHGFGQRIRWDIPLLAGYPHTFVPNVSQDPGTHRFRGIDCPELVPRVLEWRPDAVLIFTWNYRSHLHALRAFKGEIPVFFRGDSTLLDERTGPRRLARRAFLTWIYRHVDFALYVGTHNRAYFRKHGLRENQLAWAPHAVENERFTDPTGLYEAEAQKWRAELGIPSTAKTVLFAGKLEPKKSPNVLLRAFLELNDPSAHLVVVGTGPLEQELRAAAADQERVHFLGFQNQRRMPVVYRLGDVFVLPSQGPAETWGLAVNEAMACGRPVVVSERVGCAPDLVVEGENGAVIPANNVGALRRALAELLHDDSCRDTMGEASARIIRDWSIEAQAQRIEGAVCRLVQPSTSRRLCVAKG